MRLGKLLSGWTSSSKHKLPPGKAQLFVTHIPTITAAPTPPLNDEQPSALVPTSLQQQNMSLPPFPPSSAELGKSRASRQNGSTSSGGGSGDRQSILQKSSSAQRQGSALQAVFPFRSAHTTAEVPQVVSRVDQQQPAESKKPPQEQPDDWESQDCPGASVVKMTDSYIWAAIANLLQLSDPCTENEHQAAGAKHL